MKNVDSVKTALPFTNKELATQLAAQGWKIFPCREEENAKAPYNKGGFTRATCDPRQIERWWKTWPDALVGFPPGPNGLLVIDQDVKKGKQGVKAWRELSDAYQEAIGTLTPSGGIHDWYLAPDRDIGNSGGTLPKGIDVRCDGGYVCLGTLADGTCYAPDGEPDLYEILMNAEDAESWFRPLPDDILTMLPDEKDLPSRVLQSLHRDPLHISYSEGFEPVTLERLCACSDSIRTWEAPDEAGRSNSDDAFDWLTKAIVGLCQALEKDADAFGDDETRNLAELVVEADHAFMAHYDERGLGKLGYDIDRAIAWAAKEAIAFDRNRKTSTKRKEMSREKPEITIASGFHADLVSEVESALTNCGLEMYERGGMLVRPTRDKRKDSDGETIVTPCFTPVTLAWLRLQATSHIRFVKWNVKAEDYLDADPPDKLFESMLANRGAWPWKPLTGLASAPTLRPDGSILNRAGYDSATGLYMFASMTLDMPERPSKRDAERAADLLDTLLAEFPFIDDASYSAGMSMIITPVVRPMMEVAPAHFVTAPAPGTGKSELTNVTSMIALGVKCPAMSAGWSDDELEKRLGMELLGGSPIINIDNATRDLGGDTLCQTVDQPIVKARKLGVTEKIEVVNRHCVLINGNNVGPRGDFVRRSILPSMDAEMENPHKKDFKGNPCETVRKARARYIAAILTLIRAYVLAGSPNVVEKPLNGFSGWSNTVRSALIWIGYEDPCKTMDTAGDNDPEAARLRQFLHAWASDLGLGRANAHTASELAAYADGLRHMKLKDALAGFVQGQTVSARAVGNWLRYQKHRRLDGMFVDKRILDGNTKWFVDRSA